MFIGAPVNDGAIQEMNFWVDWASVRDIPRMICITICVKEVRVFLFFADFCISFFGVTLMGGSLQFCEFYFLNTWWVNVDGAWDIPWHVWEQKNQVMLMHSYSHWGALWDIEDRSEFVQWCAWVHQPNYLGILHVISQFSSALLQWEVYPRRVFFQRSYL